MRCATGSSESRNHAWRHRAAAGVAVTACHLHRTGSIPFISQFADAQAMMQRQLQRPTHSERGPNFSTMVHAQQRSFTEPAAATATKTRSCHLKICLSRHPRVALMNVTTHGRPPSRQQRRTPAAAMRLEGYQGCIRLGGWRAGCHMRGPSSSVRADERAQHGTAGRSGGVRSKREHKGALEIHALGIRGMGGGRGMDVRCRLRGAHAAPGRRPARCQSKV